VGVKIYTIAAGREGFAPSPWARPVRAALREPSREIDEPLLTDVARTTGGRYFRARDAQALERIYQEIDQLERTPVKARPTCASPRSTAGR
jgi:Ca-activated chloride channel family protein